MKTSCGKFLILAHYFPYDVKLQLLAHSWSFLANQKARNAIVGAENLLISFIRGEIIPVIIASSMEFVYEKQQINRHMSANVTDVS